MTEERPFEELVRQVRSGDQDAAAELVRRYEPHIRRAVRFALRDTRLRRVWDSMDVCQSVMKNFFARAALGQFDLDSPEDLLKLLTTMARNNLATKARSSQVSRRKISAPGEDSDLPFAGPSSDPSPSRVIAGRDLLQAVKDRLTDEERQLVDHRAAGRPWEVIAAEMGGNAEALRKRHARALDRVAKELGLDEESS